MATAPILYGGIGDIERRFLPSIRNFSANTIVVRLENAPPDSPRWTTTPTGKLELFTELSTESNLSWAGDWLKVSDGIHVTIESSGDPTPYASSSWISGLACWNSIRLQASAKATAEAENLNPTE